MRFTIAASWALPVVSDPIQDAAIIVDRGEVLFVGPQSESSIDEGLVICQDGWAVAPGLVNSHTHLELSHLDQIGKHGPFLNWIARLLRLREAASSEDAISAVRREVRMLENCGTALVADISNRCEHLSELARSDVEFVIFAEVTETRPDRARNALIASEAQVERAQVCGIAAYISPHGIHSVCEEVIDAIAKRKERTSLHLAEGTAESEWIQLRTGQWGNFLAHFDLEDGWSTFPADTPVGCAISKNLVRPDSLLVHCVQVSDGEWTKLRKLGCTVVFCPRSNTNLAVGRPDISTALKHGVNCCLGTDSLASTESLDILDEARFVHRNWPDVAPRELLRMITVNGANALGFPTLGRIEIGAKGSLMRFRCNADENPLEVLLNPETATERFPTPQADNCDG